MKFIVLLSTPGVLEDLLKLQAELKLVAAAPRQL